MFIFAMLSSCFHQELLSILAWSPKREAIAAHENHDQNSGACEYILGPWDSMTACRFNHRVLYDVLMCRRPDKILDLGQGAIVINLGAAAA